MNKNHTSSGISCSILVVRAGHSQRLASCLNWNLFKCLRSYLFCVVTALLLSATDMPAATIAVTNGNDSGQLPYGKRSLTLRQAIPSISPRALRLFT
jgi:hypothetical protein